MRWSRSTSAKGTRFRMRWPPATDRRNAPCRPPSDRRRPTVRDGMEPRKSIRRLGIADPPAMMTQASPAAPVPRLSRNQLAVLPVMQCRHHLDGTGLAPWSDNCQGWESIARGVAGLQRANARLVGLTAEVGPDVGEARASAWLRPLVRRGSRRRRRLFPYSSAACPRWPSACLLVIHRATGLRARPRTMFSEAISSDRSHGRSSGLDRARISGSRAERTLGRRNLPLGEAVSFTCVLLRFRRQLSSG